MSRKHKIFCLFLVSLLVVLAAAREPILRLYYRVDFLPLILRESERNRVSPYLVAAIIFNESRFRTHSESDAGALGLMQLMPDTATEMAQKAGLDEFSVASLGSPETNIQLGTLYLAELLSRFPAEEEAVAAYNAGPTVVRSWREQGRGIAFEETRAYVENVGRTKRALMELYPEWERG